MLVGSQPGEDPPGVDLVLSCSTVVLVDALVLPTDGANCGCTIFRAQTPFYQALAQDATHNKYFVEDGL